MKPAEQYGQSITPFLGSPPSAEVCGVDYRRQRQYRKIHIGGRQAPWLILLLLGTVCMWLLLQFSGWAQQSSMQTKHVNARIGPLQQPMIAGSGALRPSTRGGSRWSVTPLVGPPYRCVVLSLPHYLIAPAAVPNNVS